MIYIVLLLLLLLWKYSTDIRKGWLLFIAVTSIIVEARSAPFSIVTLAILIGLWKVALDLYHAGK